MENSAPVSAIDTQFLKVTEMIHCYAESVGLNREQAHNKEKKNWMWKKGSASIELYINRLDFGDGYKRDFLRIFSPIMEVPQTTRLLEFYRRLLELNDEKLGIKIAIQKGSNKVWGTFERDIKGIDYNELSTFIADFEYWADKFDDMLKEEFPNLN